MNDYKMTKMPISLLERLRKIESLFYSDQFLPFAKPIGYGIVLLLIMGLGYLYFQIFDKEMMGFIHDDGLYMITAKAIAQGKGPFLLHIPGEPAQIKYPLLFPLYLSIGWLINPHFPENLPLFALLCTGITAAGMMLCFTFFWSVKKLSWLSSLTLTLLVALNYYFMYFNTTLMSEGLYFFLTMLTLVLAETWCQNTEENQSTPIPWHRLLLLALLSALCFHTRQFGLTLIGAISIWLFFRKNLTQALQYALPALCLSIIPWSLWVHSQKPLMTDVTYPVLKSIGDYGFEFLENNRSVLESYQERVYHASGTLVYSLYENMFPIFANLLKIIPSEQVELITQNKSLFLGYLALSTVLSYLLLGYFIVQITHYFKSSTPSKSLSISVLYLVLYLTLAVFWGYDSQLNRFLPMVIPIVWYLFYKPFIQPAEEDSEYPQTVKPTSFFKRNPKAKSIFFVLSFFLAFCNAQNHFNTIAYLNQHHYVDMKGTPHLWEDYKASIQFIRQTLPTEAILSTPNDVIYYLYTGRKTVFTGTTTVKVLPSEIPPQDKFKKLTSEDRYKWTLSASVLERFNQTLDYYHADYLIVEPQMIGRNYMADENPIQQYLIQTHPEQYRLVYASPHRHIKIYRRLNTI